ncbi:MAG: hypothetical protein CL583_01940 [Alteromonadaceae bacterium]|nr:hypothetical protein [Alteromonadaceae bacterium]|tara:strand:- start:672 stop:1172 length:501 start_codon:yes stop_codon:yes gene_type:complete
MTQLYKLSEQFQELNALMEAEDDGSLKEAVENTLELVQGDFNDKAQALITVCQNMEGDAAAIDSEIKRLQARKKAIENRQAAMKDYLRDNMERTGISKVSCPLFTITCVKGREIAIINDEQVIPDDYVVVKTEIRPDKALIAKALKDGYEVPGCSLDRAKSSIRIK